MLPTPMEVLGGEGLCAFSSRGSLSLEGQGHGGWETPSRSSEWRPCRSLFVDAVNLEAWKQAALRDLLEKRPPRVQAPGLLWEAVTHVF